MAGQRIPRYEQPPPALSNMGDSNRASFMSVMSELSASAASAASASSLSAAEASSTADSYSETDEYTSLSASSTTETLGVVVPASTASNPAATQTDSYGSTITSPAPTAGQTTSLPASSTKSTPAVASDHSSNGPDSSLATADRGYHTGPSSGQIAAAVVIPIVILLALGFSLFYLRRRRRRRSAALASQQFDQHHHPMTDRSAFSKEAAVLPKPSQPRHPRSNPTAPILTTTTNNAYYTGLSTPTTPSRASTQTRGHASADTDRRAMSPYDIPPPAYAKHAPPGSTPTLPQLSFAADPFMDPISPVPSEDRDPHSPTAAALAALSGRDSHPTATSLSPVSNFSRPHGGVSRTGTMRSIGAASFASDMYSDTASVHSARPARMSGGAAVETQVVNRLSAGEGSFAPGLVVGSGRGDPFGDPR